MISESAVPIALRRSTRPSVNPQSSARKRPSPGRRRLRSSLGSTGGPSDRAIEGRPGISRGAILTPRAAAWATQAGETITMTRSPVSVCRRTPRMTRRAPLPRSATAVPVTMWKIAVGESRYPRRVLLLPRPRLRHHDIVTRCPFGVLPARPLTIAVRILFCNLLPRTFYLAIVPHDAWAPVPDGQLGRYCGIHQQSGPRVARGPVPSSMA